MLLTIRLWNSPEADISTSSVKLSNGLYTLSIISKSNVSAATIPVSAMPLSSSFWWAFATNPRKMLPAPKWIHCGLFRVFSATCA
ncbi:hypothetical protein D3C81_1114410 [compost metagenome]